MLQNGADRNILDNKGRTPLNLANEKNKTTIAEMLNLSSIKCYLCVIKPPLEKVERNNYNIIFFVIVHFLFESFVTFFILLPKFSTSVFFQIITYIYILLFCVIFANHWFLVYSDPGFLKNMSRLTLLNLVEKNLKINDYCPVCVVFYFKFFRFLRHWFQNIAWSVIYVLTASIIIATGSITA